MRNFLFIILASFITTHAFAAEILIFSEKARKSDGIEDAIFKVNAKKGRAWVEFSTYEGDWEDDWYTEYRRKVKGLTFDIETEEIVFEKDGIKTVCATTSMSRSGRTRYIRKTGNCYFTDYVVKELLDDGFETEWTKVRKLFLVIK